MHTSRYDYREGSLKKFGVSPHEWDILIYVGYGSGGKPESIAGDAMTTHGEEEEPFVLSHREYLSVIDTSIRKGWLTILTFADLVNEQGRRRLSPGIHPPEDECFRVGSLDFTQLGYDIYSGVITDFGGAEGMDPHEAFRVILDEMEFQITGRTKAACEASISAIEQEWAHVPHRLLVSEPVEIGRWSPNRFRSYDQGVQIMVRVDCIESARSDSP